MSGLALIVCLCLLGACASHSSPAAWTGAPPGPASLARAAPSDVDVTEEMADSTATGLSHYRREGTYTSLVGVLEAAPPTRQGVAAGLEHAQVLTELGLLRSARAELNELVTSASSSPLDELAIIARAKLDGAAPADPLPGDEMGRALAALAAGDSLPLRTWLDDAALPAALARVRLGLEPDPALRAAVGALRRSTPDRLPGALLADLKSALRRFQRSGANPLPGADAWKAAQEARRRYLPEESLAAAERAVALLGSRAPAWAARATLLASAAELQLQHFDSALGRLARLRNLAAQQHWLDVEGRSEWLEGLIRLQQGDAIVSRSLFRKARIAFERAREPGLAGAVLALEADAQAVLGDLEGSLVLRVRALQILERCGLNDRLSVALEEGARALERAGYPRAALAFLDEAEAVAGPAAEPLVRAEQATKRAVAALHAGLVDLALTQADAAAAATAGVASDDLRQSTIAGVAAVRGAALAGRDPVAALAALDAAVNEYVGRDYGLLLVGALHERGRAERALGHTDDALRDFERAFALATAGGNRLRDWQQQALFVETQRAVVDDLIAYQLDVALDTRAALAWALRARHTGERAGGPMELGGAESGAVTLVAFALPDRLVLWRLSEGELTTTEVLVERSRLIRRIGRFRQSLLVAARVDEVVSEAAALFALTLAPVREDLEAGTPIDIVADGVLVDLPFAVLRDAESGLALADLATWRLVPRPLRQAPSPLPVRPSALSLLAVSNPTLSRWLAADLPPLANAREEAIAVATRFRSAEILDGSQASREAVLKRLSGHDVLHIAAHAVAHRDTPGAAAILLAGEGGSWRAVDIAPLHLAHLRLVVLAGCETAMGFPSTLSGPMSLANAFLAAGADSVLATQWPLDDRVSRRFMAAFYDGLERTGIPALALAETQRSFQASPDPIDRRPASWAGYFIAADAPGRPTEEVAP